MRLFRTQKPAGLADFEYLDERSVYLDSACQTLRPQPVIDAMIDYFHTYNACGGRVKYEWGLQVDERVNEARQRVLSLLGKAGSEYVVAFTLNTTYGINLVLGQLPPRFAKVVTSDIEHNSVFLPTIAAASRLNVPRLVLSRSPDGSLTYGPNDLSGAVVVLNSLSNIDARPLSNAAEVARDAHASGGILLLDAAQSVSHDRELLRSTDFDAAFFSGHKIYSPSLGVIVIKRTLLSALDIHFTGGGTVEDVERDAYVLLSSEEDAAARLEPGLQDFGAIIGLSAAIQWMERYRPEGRDARAHQAGLSRILFESLAKEPAVTLVNSQPAPIVSCWSSKIDAHRLAIYLSSQHVMVRSGYFCCHYFLKELKGYPPLVRVSLGLHNTEAQLGRFMSTLKAILANA